MGIPDMCDEVDPTMRVVHVDFNEEGMQCVDGLMAVDFTGQSEALQQVCLESFSEPIGERSLTGGPSMQNHSSHRRHCPTQTFRRACIKLGYIKVTPHFEVGHIVIDGRVVRTHGELFGYDHRVDDTTKRMQQKAHYDNPTHLNKFSDEERAHHVQSCQSYPWDRILLKVNIPDGTSGCVQPVRFMYRLSTGESVILQFKSSTVGLVSCGPFLDLHHHGAVPCTCPRVYPAHSLCSATLMLNTTGPMTGVERLLLIRRDMNNREDQTIPPRPFPHGEWGLKEDDMIRGPYFARYERDLHAGALPVIQFYGTLIDEDGGDVFQPANIRVVARVHQSHPKGWCVQMDEGGEGGELWRRMGCCGCMHHNHTRLKYKLPDTAHYSFPLVVPMEDRVFFINGREYIVQVTHREDCKNTTVKAILFRDAPRLPGAAAGFVTAGSLLLEEVTAVAKSVRIDGTLPSIPVAFTPLNLLLGAVRTASEALRLRNPEVGFVTIPEPRLAQPLRGFGQMSNDEALRLLLVAAGTLCPPLCGTPLHPPPPPPVQSNPFPPIPNTSQACEQPPSYSAVMTSDRGGRAGCRLTRPDTEAFECHEHKQVDESDASFSCTECQQDMTIHDRYCFCGKCDKPIHVACAHTDDQFIQTCRRCHQNTRNPPVSTEDSAVTGDTAGFLIEDTEAVGNFSDQLYGETTLLPAISELFPSMTESTSTDKVGRDANVDEILNTYYGHGERTEQGGGDCLMSDLVLTGASQRDGMTVTNNVVGELSSNVVESPLKKVMDC